MNFSFILSALKAPNEVGAIAPSSGFLAKRMVAAARLDKSRAVVEVGTGSGKITRKIHEGLPAGATFLSVEKNIGMYEMARRGLGASINIVNADILAVSEKLTELNMNVDCIISSLPLTLWSSLKQKAVIDKMHEILIEGGRMVFYSYLTGPVNSRRKLLSHIKMVFSGVEMTEVVWLNVPPAMIYVCRK